VGTDRAGPAAAKRREECDVKICIYGAGAIGGYLAVELALTGVDVTVIARGPHLEAIGHDGLTLLIGDERKVAKVACTDDPAEAGQQDCVIITPPSLRKWRLCWATIRRS